MTIDPSLRVNVVVAFGVGSAGCHSTTLGFSGLSFFALSTSVKNSALLRFGKRGATAAYNARACVPVSFPGHGKTAAPKYVNAELDGGGKAPKSIVHGNQLRRLVISIVALSPYCANRESACAFCAAVRLLYVFFSVSP